MIGFLQGQVKIKRFNSLIIMASGVGYLVYVPGNLLTEVKTGDQISLFVHTHVREDELSLFGFLNASGLEVFEWLISISGIGCRTALNVIDRGVEPIRVAVANADVAFFTSIPRLGKKNAQKIIIELKPKFGSLSELDLTEDVSGETRQVMEALSSMGFSRSEISGILRQIPEGAISVEDKIKAALKMFGRKI